MKYYLPDIENMGTGNQSLDIGQKEFDLLKKEYAKAKEGNKMVFLFMGRKILTAYAKYMIEFLTPKFK